MLSGMEEFNWLLDKLRLAMVELDPRAGMLPQKLHLDKYLNTSGVSGHVHAGAKQVLH